MRATIVDTDHDALVVAQVGDLHPGAEGQFAVGGAQAVLVEGFAAGGAIAVVASAVIGGRAGFVIAPRVDDVAGGAAGEQSEQGASGNQTLQSGGSEG